MTNTQVDKLKYLSCQGNHKIPPLTLNNLSENSQTTVILGKFKSKP